MVRGLILAAAIGASAPSATAQAVDWEGAGGDLFAPSFIVVPDPEQAIGRSPAPRRPYDALIAEAAAAQGLDPKLLHALVLTESAYRPDAVSSAGAAGLTQLMPATARELGVRDRHEPGENVRGGAAYLARQIARFGDLRLALAAYNAGPARVARAGAVPDIPETRAYVDTVVECFLTLTAGRVPASSRECRRTEARP